jgi:hypothetical protein
MRQELSTGISCLLDLELLMSENPAERAMDRGEKQAWVEFLCWEIEHAGAELGSFVPAPAPAPAPDIFISEHGQTATGWE